MSQFVVAGRPFHLSTVIGIDIGLSGGLQLGVNESVLLVAPLVRVVGLDILDPPFYPLDALLSISIPFFAEAFTPV